MRGHYLKMQKKTKEKTEWDLHVQDTRYMHDALQQRNVLHIYMWFSPSLEWEGKKENVVCQ